MKPSPLLLWRYLWPGLWTALGLLLGAVALALGGRARLVGGTCEIAGGRLAAALQRVPGCRPFGAITLGHVILGIDRPTLERLRRHERVHVRQYEAWGPLFVPAYLAASAWLWARRRDPHRDNPFERAARAR